MVKFEKCLITRNAPLSSFYGYQAESGYAHSLHCKVLVKVDRHGNLVSWEATMPAGSTLLSAWEYESLIRWYAENGIYMAEHIGINAIIACPKSPLYYFLESLRQKEPK